MADALYNAAVLGHTVCVKLLLPYFTSDWLMQIVSTMFM